MKRILVTGGPDFIGSHLCERLLDQGHEVLCVENFYTGARRNVARLMDNPNFELMRHDNVNPIGSRFCYNEGRRCAETLFFDYRHQHNLRIKVARIFNTYGPRIHPNDGAWCRTSSSRR